MSLNITPLDLAWMQHQAEEELEEQAAIVAARQFYNGRLDPAILDQLQAGLISDDAPSLPELFNVYATVIDEILVRLSIVELVDRPTEDGQPVPWAMDIWQNNDLDGLQYDLFEAVLVDGEGYLIVQLEPEDPEDEAGATIPKIYIHRRFSSAEIGGTNDGMKAHYHNGRLEMISKRWIETVYEDNKPVARQRMTLYIAATAEEPARIEKYAYGRDGWEQHQDDRDPAWPIPWTDNSGRSLPLPAVHVKAPRGRRRGEHAAGPQIIIDNLIASLVTAAGLVGVPMLKVIGGYPTSDGLPPDEDGSNLWRLGPGRILGFPGKEPSGIEIDAMRPGSLTEIIHAMKETMSLVAIVTGTPSIMAKNLGSQPVAAELLKQVDIRPTATTRQMQNSIGNGFTRIFDAIRLISPALNGPSYPEQTVHAQWLAADVRGLQVANQPQEEDQQPPAEKAALEAEAATSEAAAIEEAPVI